MVGGEDRVGIFGTDGAFRIRRTLRQRTVLKGICRQVGRKAPEGRFSKLPAQPATAVLPQSFAGRQSILWFCALFCVKMPFEHTLNMQRYPEF